MDSPGLSLVKSDILLKDIVEKSLFFMCMQILWLPFLLRYAYIVSLYAYIVSARCLKRIITIITSDCFFSMTCQL